MPDNLTDTLDVVTISANALDPAINANHPRAQELLTKYARTRSPEDLAALAERYHPGKKPWVYKLSALTVTGFEVAQNGTTTTDPTRYSRAFSYSCFAVVDPDGREYKAPLMSRSADEDRYAAPKWTTTVALELKRGMGAVKEVGSLALMRAEVSADVADPYWPLPGGLRLPL